VGVVFKKAKQTENECKETKLRRVQLEKELKGRSTRVKQGNHGDREAIRKRKG